MDNVREASYRAFTKSYLYFDKNLNEEQSQLPKIFPNKESENLVINTTKKNFSTLMTENTPDYHIIGDNQAFPLYFYNEFGEKEFALSEFALQEFQKRLNDTSVSKEEIFYYIYAIFHHKAYKEKYKFDLAKEAPRIGVSKDFKILSALGFELATLHINYEKGELYKEVEFKDGLLSDFEKDEFYKVAKMKKLKNEKQSFDIIYNENIIIKNIPALAFEYIINGKSAIDIIIERYQVSIDKDTLIKNDPNEFKGSKYIYELLLRIIDLSLKSVALCEKISKYEFE